MALKQLGKVGQEIFEARYAFPGEKSWAERARVIAKTGASCESDEEKELIFEKFYEAIGAGDKVPGGRIIFGCGRANQNLLNCFQISPEDNVDSIGKLLQDTYKISCGGGGIGFNFCVAPTSKILKTDLTWINADEVKSGDNLIGFDENPNMHESRLRESKVNGIKKLRQPCLKIITDQGETICSTKHRWVAKPKLENKKKGQGYRWVEAENLKIGNYIAFSIKPWKFENSYDGGWMSGLMDGEGWLSYTLTSKNNKSGHVGIGQNPGLVLDKAKTLLDQWGFNYIIDEPCNYKCERIRFRGKWECMKALGMFRPYRLMPKSKYLWEGCKPGGGQTKCAKILSIEYIGEQDVIAIDTSTSTFICDGFLSHNSKIRPKGDDINIIKNSAPGSVSVMKLINEEGNHVRAGKNRRTALIAILNVTHPDLLEFLDVKLDKGQLNNFNISVGITNRFIEAVENNEEWYFTFNNKRYHLYRLERIVNDGVSVTFAGQELPREPEFIDIVALSSNDAIDRAKNHYKKHFTDDFKYKEVIHLKAKDIWDRIFKSSVECGDPGFFNIDLANSYTNVSYFSEIMATNPCGEIPLENYGNCCLGNINLSNMVLEDGSDVDWKRLANAVRIGVRFLDNIITINHYPIEECKKVGQNSRRIGLGFLGFHYMLIKLGIRYGSDKCLEFTERLVETIRNEAYLTSVYLARDKGPFPAFDSKKYLETDYSKTLPPRIRHLIKQYGIRNAVMLTVPPTGTIGMLMETSTGIEPIFAWAYKRRYRSSNVWKEQVIVDPLFKEYYEAGKDLSLFVGAYDIEPEDHMKVQAAVQKYIDSAVSKTINLPADADWQKLSKTALNYMSYLKGLTIYRAGSKGGEPLEAIPLTKENIEKYMNSEPIIEMTEGGVCAVGDNSCGA